MQVNYKKEKYKITKVISFLTGRPHINISRIDKGGLETIIDPFELGFGARDPSIEEMKNAHKRHSCFDLYNDILKIQAYGEIDPPFDPENHRTVVVDGEEYLMMMGLYNGHEYINIENLLTGMEVQPFFREVQEVKPSEQEFMRCCDECLQNLRAFKLYSNILEEYMKSWEW